MLPIRQVIIRFEVKFAFSNLVGLPRKSVNLLCGIWVLYLLPSHEEGFKQGFYFYKINLVNDKCYAYALLMEI